MNVATFPWDPKPDVQAAPVAAQAAAPAPTAQAPAPQPQPQQQPASNYTQSTLSPQNGRPLSLPNNPHGNANGVAIKTEPGQIKPDPVVKQEPGVGGAQPPLHPSYAVANAARGGVAAERAAQALESQFGQRAAASINAIQSGMNQTTPAHQGQQVPQPGQPLQQQHGRTHQQLSPRQQYQAQIAAHLQQRMPPNGPGNGPNGLPSAQVDGSSDVFDAALVQRGPDGRPVEMGRVEIDNLLHAQLAARAKEMEGGGLMLSLKEATKHSNPAVKKRSTDGSAQFDGPDDDMKDDDLDDEDAINSDLDDPDDEKDDDEDDDETMGHMMLCMYDKVQRVKNKW